MPTPPRSTSPLDRTDARPTNGIPRLTGDIRPLIPKLGLRNYWYPALEDRPVGRRKPLKVSLLGEELCLFRGAGGDVVAIQDVCPHRGARLSEGDCHYRGTVACPYHGWVYDESGKNVMVLSEGPGSGVCGKAGTEARAYPTRTLKGVVFVWIGEGPPAPIEEDVPEEFFDDETLILVGQVDWRCNWEVALENSMDSHVNYVHRNAVVVARAGFIARGAQGEHPFFVGVQFRYFFDSDRDHAQAVSTQLESQLPGGADVPVLDFTGYEPKPRQGHLEVWLGR